MCSSCTKRTANAVAYFPMSRLLSLAVLCVCSGTAASPLGAPALAPLADAIEPALAMAPVVRPSSLLCSFLLLWSGSADALHYMVLECACLLALSLARASSPAKPSEACRCPICEIRGCCIASYLLLWILP